MSDDPSAEARSAVPAAGRRPWLPWALGGLAVVTVVVVAVVLATNGSLTTHRSLPTRPAGWHIQARSRDIPAIGVDHGADLFPVGNDVAVSPYGHSPPTGAPGDMVGPDYRYELVGSWALPTLDTHDQFRGWSNLQDATAPEGFEVLVASVAPHFPTAPDDLRKPPPDDVSVVTATSTFPLTFPSPTVGTVIEAIVRKGSPVRLQVRDRGHVNRLDLRTGRVTGDLPQQVRTRTAPVELSVPWQGNATAPGIAGECRFSGRLTADASVFFQPSSAAVPGPPGRAYVVVTLSVVPSANGQGMEINGHVDCGKSPIAGIMFPNLATGTLTLDLARAISLRGTDGRLVPAQQPADILRCSVANNLYTVGCPDPVAKAQHPTLSVVFDVPDTANPSTLVFTPGFTLSGGFVRIAARAGNVPLVNYRSTSAPTAIAFRLR